MRSPRRHRTASGRRQRKGVRRQHRADHHQRKARHQRGLQSRRRAQQHQTRTVGCQHKVCHMLDGETAGPSHDAWFGPLSAAAGFQQAVGAGSASRSGSSRHCQAGPPLKSLASWRSQRSDALIPRVAGFSIGMPRAGRTHHLSNAVMRVIAPFVCLTSWDQG